MRVMTSTVVLVIAVLSGCRSREVPCQATKSPWAELLRADLPLTYAYIDDHYDENRHDFVTETDDKGAPLVRRVTLEPGDRRHSAIIELWRTDGLKPYPGYLGGTYARVPQEPSHWVCLLLQKQADTDVRIELIPTGPIVIEAHGKTSELLSGRSNWYSVMTLLRAPEG
jgi:hypothetical protein